MLCLKYIFLYTIKNYESQDDFGFVLHRSDRCHFSRGIAFAISWVSSDVLLSTQPSVKIAGRVSLYSTVQYVSIQIFFVII